MDEPTESHEVIVRDPGATGMLPPGAQAHFLPKSVSELATMAKFAAQSHLFGVPDTATALNIMLAGAHLGLTPYAALEGITLVKGRPIISAQIQWTLILARGQVTEHDIDCTADHCAITVTSRKWREPKTQRVSIEDVPAHLKADTKYGEKPNWVKFPEDMLFAYCVRKLRKRHFPEVMVGALDTGDDFDTVTAHAEVIDVGTVEEHIGGEIVTPCPKVLGEVSGIPAQCGLPTELVPGRSGGMFLRCTEGHMMPPPQAVRDAIRGHKEGTAAIQQEASDDGAVVAVEVQEGAAEVAELVQADVRSAPEDERPAEAPEPAVMGRKEVDEHVQSILTSLTAAKRTGHITAAQTVLRAHGWDETPLTSWLMRHPEELPGLVIEFTMDEPA